MEITKLLPGTTERMLIVGATGTGKTTLAKCLLKASMYPSILVIDPKCTYGGKDGMDGYKMIRSPSGLRWLGKEARIQYRPDVKHQSVSDYDTVYKWAYRRQEVMVYTDETFLVMDRNFAPDWLRACVTCGRELGVGMIFATQRPRGVDLRILTESDVLSMFDLRHRDDRKRMSEIMGETVMQPLGRHEFWHWRTGMPNPVPMKVTLGKVNV